ncbi:hypothetical protein CC78DRAFT_438385, partial [Lojkania enalia]
TFTDLKAAKEFAKGQLKSEGYDIEFFKTYEVKDPAKTWEYGDGVIVYAVGPSDELFKVELDTISNTHRLQGDQNGRIQEPVYHVLQTIIDYNSDRSGFERYSIVEVTCTSRELARAHALRVLLADGDVKKEDFVEYDEYADGAEGPFGADVLVHAVKDGGYNVLVSV